MSDIILLKICQAFFVNIQWHEFMITSVRPRIFYHCYIMI